MKKDSVIWIGAGQIGLAIVRRIASGKKIIIGDKNIVNVWGLKRSDKIEIG